VSTPHPGGVDPTPDPEERGAGGDGDLTELATTEDTTSTDAYPHVEKWVQEWFAPVVAVRLAAGDTGRGLTWCAPWWAHPGVAARLHALWQAWEAARQSRDAAAMSSWWTSHADHHLRALLDGEHGPMWRCSPTQHRPSPTWQWWTHPTAGSIPPPPTANDDPALLSPGCSRGR